MKKDNTGEKVWIVTASVTSPESAEALLDYIGKHLVAVPVSRPGDKASGQLIALDPEAQTASLRRYDNDCVTVVPWLGTEFRATTCIDAPFAELKPGARRRFEWFHDADGRETHERRTLVGTVDLVKPEVVHLWVRDEAYSAGGWWATIHAADAARHSLRAVNLTQGTE
ncbi:hypothetical protein ABZ517_05790 [Streptomyces scabiei]|uniref:hypothetical protein n=1 Tax=Streptomyces scabiei TaxID=1930 RepID=UPI0033CE4D64